MGRVDSGWGLALPYRKISGSSSGVERKLPKLDVAGSIPVSRSTIRLANVGRADFYFFLGIAVGTISIYLYR